MKKTDPDVLLHNRTTWNRAVQNGNRWTVPVSSDVVENARKGVWNVFLTPTIPVPREWFPEIKDLKVLCLASGGGQQGPVLAAAGALVTVFDNSPAQLAQDAFVAERDSLSIATVQGDMADLSCFNNESFDLVFHPVSNAFVPDVLPVWNEAWRVLKKGGRLLAGFTNPYIYIFDMEKEEQGILEIRNRLPYSSSEVLTGEERRQMLEKGFALEFSHSLDTQIGGQLKAGFVISGFFEDNDEDMACGKYMPTFIATKADKPASG
ncbi:MAG: class I SAM-dependent methyltransferase [Candidatus Xenobiia bacterium LiM19]